MTIDDTKTARQRQMIVRWISRHFGWVLYFLYLASELLILYYGRTAGLFPAPGAGTDQLTTLEGALALSDGVWPGANYGYSLSYTAFLALIGFLANGDLVVMRILQSLFCALAPVAVYQLARRLRLGQSVAMLAGLLLCFYAPALLISLDFLREIPLLIVFTYYLYALAAGSQKKSARWYFAAGVLAALTYLGRENMLPLLLMPLAAVAYPKYRKLVCDWRQWRWGLIGGVAALGIFFAVNYGHNGILLADRKLITADRGGVIGSIGALAASGLQDQFGAKLYSAFASYELPNSLSVYAHSDVIDYMKILVVNFHWLVALAAVALLFQWRKPMVLLFGIGIAGYLFSLIFFFTFYRYRLPVAGLLVLLAALGAMSLWRLYRKKQWGKLIAGAAAAVAMVGFLQQNPWQLRTQNECEAVIRILVDGKHFVKAHDYLNQMSNHGKRSVPGELFLLRTLVRDGDQGLAEVYYNEWRQKQ